MIFAEMEYGLDYSDFHAELAAFVSQNFSRVEFGLQSDSWISVLDGAEKVQIDTFTSMKHQVKSQKAGPHVQIVIDVLCSKYQLRIQQPPELEMRMRISPGNGDPINSSMIPA